MLYAYFPEEITTQTYFHVVSVSFVAYCCESLQFILMFAICFRVCDKRFTSVYVTSYATMSNMAGTMHNFYIYKLVDMLDIYYPQLMISVVSIVGVLFLVRELL